jgi:hypothetical protein
VKHQHLLRFSFVHHAQLHHEAHILHHAYVVQRIAAYRDQKSVPKAIFTPAL